MSKLKQKQKESPFLNKGTISGLVTVLSGVAELLAVFGVLPLHLVVPLVGAVNTVAGAITTKDSVDQRKK